MRFTKERVQEIKARAEAATPGPWEHDSIPYVDVKKSEFVRDAICVVGVCEQNKKDAEFIAHARQDIPEMICEIESRQQEIQQLQAQMANMREKINFLWKLLDNIDTAGDMAKSNDKAYRSIVESIHPKRFIVAESDGYEIFIKDDNAITYHNPADVAEIEQLKSQNKLKWQVIKNMAAQFPECPFCGAKECEKHTNNCSLYKALSDDIKYNP